jgi:hypothetical protein
MPENIPIRSNAFGIHDSFAQRDRRNRITCRWLLAASMTWHHFFIRHSSAIARFSKAQAAMTPCGTPGVPHERVKRMATETR